MHVTSCEYHHALTPACFALSLLSLQLKKRAARVINGTVTNGSARGFVMPAAPSVGHGHDKGEATVQTSVGHRHDKGEPAQHSDGSDFEPKVLAVKNAARSDAATPAASIEDEEDNEAIIDAEERAAIRRQLAKAHREKVRRGAHRQTHLAHGPRQTRVGLSLHFPACTHTHLFHARQTPLGQMMKQR